MPFLSFHFILFYNETGKKQWRAIILVGLGYTNVVQTHVKFTCEVAQMACILGDLYLIYLRGPSPVDLVNSHIFIFVLFKGIPLICKIPKYHHTNRQYSINLHMPRTWPLVTIQFMYLITFINLLSRITLILHAQL